MKTLSNKSILLIMINCSMLLFSCGTHNYERTDYIGVYYYKLLYKEYGILNYLILRNDSTYQFVYIDKNDTLKNSDKWYYRREGDFMRIRFYRWCFLGMGTETAYDKEQTSIYCAFYQSPSCLGFSPDVDANFWRIDSLEAIQLGIKEEGITW